MNKNIKFCACKYENIIELNITPQINNNLTAVNREYFCLFAGDSHARFGVLRGICSIFTNQLFCKPFPQQEFEPPSLL